jgi:FkbH-like protein
MSQSSSQSGQSSGKLAIAATFTSEPIAAALTFWMQELALSLAVEFAPYNQVFQQLLDPTSLLSTNAGVNVVLVRFEDWLRFAAPTEANIASRLDNKLQAMTQELIAALQAAVTRTAAPHATSHATPYIVAICPAQPDSPQQPLFEALEAQVANAVSGLNGVHLLTSKELAYYPVADYYDPQGDKLGHVPFTELYFTALGSAIARRVYAIKAAPYKVIVLDCDNTLWQGVVGEEGVAGIAIPPAVQILQQMIVAQQQAGMLICLCSKNNEADVLEVFEQREDMILQRQHLVNWRINWLPKSENLKSLAQELNLGLDSFIFIDDSPMECAEVRRHCPEVLTLQLPQLSEIPQFLQHVWAFDRLKTTAADQQRTELYRQNLERERFASSVTITEFLAGLELQVTISEPTPDQLDRVAQLTQRTNQFNFTTIRRTASELQQQLQTGLECRIVEVRDRFGDYGLVGVMLFRYGSSQLQLDSFLLSCRVLGRGVEHQMLNHLGQLAQAQSLTTVAARYIPTAKNQPARNFLQTIGQDYQQPDESGIEYYFPTDIVATLTYSGSTPTPDDLPQSQKPLAERSVEYISEHTSERLNRIANSLNRPEQILQILESQRRSNSSRASDNFVAPRTATEIALANIWQKLLRIEPIGIQDDFITLGGTSLTGVSLFSQIETQFGKNLPLTTLLQASTIADLAALIDQSTPVGSTSWSALVPLQPQGSQPPLFCPHAAGGNVLVYRNLVPYLGDDQPLYGLQPKGLDGEEQPFESFLEIAEYYIEAMQTLQPQGTYYVAGLSSGGKLSLAIAEKLLERGETVGFVGMFDTPAPGYPKLLPATSVPRYVLNRAQQIFDNHWNQLQLLEPRQKLDYLVEKLQIVPREILKLVKEFYWQRGKKLPPALEKVQAANRKALKGYMPKAYPGKLTLFRATKQPVGCVIDPELGWSTVVEGEIEVHEVPGYHAGVIVEPHVRVLGTQLKACLEQAQAMHQ